MGVHVLSVAAGNTGSVELVQPNTLVLTITSACRLPHLTHVPLHNSLFLWVITGERGLKGLGRVALPHPLGTLTCSSAGGAEHSVALAVLGSL